MRRELIYVSLAAGLVLSAHGAAKADVSKGHSITKPSRTRRESRARPLTTLPQVTP